MIMKKHKDRKAIKKRSKNSKLISLYSFFFCVFFSGFQSKMWLWVILFLSIILSCPLEGYCEVVYIKTKIAKLRLINNDNDSPAIALLKERDEVDIKKMDGCWLRVFIKKKEVAGWIHASEVTYLKPEEEEKMISESKEEEELDNLFAKIEKKGGGAINEPTTGFSIRAGEKIFTEKPKKVKYSFKKAISDCGKIK